MIDWRMLNERVNDLSLNSFNTLIVTDWDDIDWEGVPDMVPFDELIFKPLGREPDVIEKEISSPLTVGEIENGLSLVIT